MITIFDGFARLSDDELRGQIAILSCVTLSNTIKGIWQSKKVKKQIEESYNSLSGNDRDTLDIRLKQDLINKCNSLGNYRFDENTTDEEVHLAVIYEAGRVYAIDEYKTPATRMDEIHEQYYSHYLRVLLRKLERLEEKERIQMENRIQREITKRDINQIRQLAVEFMLKEFNGANVLSAVVSSHNTSKLKRVIDVCGMGIFDGIEGVISTANDSVLMFCRMERALLAQAVWMAVNGYGKRIRQNDDLMPSFSNGLLQEESEKEKRLLILISREAQLNKILRGILGDIDKNNKKLELKEELFKKDTVRLLQLTQEQGELDELREKTSEDGKDVKERYEQYVKRNPARNNQDMLYQRLKNDYENLARNIRNIDGKISDNEKKQGKLTESIHDQQKQITVLRDTLKELRETLVNYVNEFNDVIMQLENEAGYLSRVLERKWTKFYPILTFESKVYEMVVKQFTQREIVVLERMLKEFEECSVKEAFARNRDHCVICLVAAGKYAKIIFEDNHILEIQVKDKK